MTTNYRTFLGRMSVGGLASALSSLRNVILLPFLTRGLSVEEFGAWIQAIALVELLASVSVIIFSAALTRFASSAADEEIAARGFWSSMASVFVISSLLALLTASQTGWIAGAFFPGQDHRFLLLASAALVPITACERLLLAFFHARLQIARQALCLLLESILYVGVTVWLLQQGTQAAGVLVVLLATRMLVLFGGCGFVLTAVGIARPDLGMLRAYVRFGLPLVGVAVFSWVSSSSDRYVINWFHGPAMVGAYSVAYTLGMHTAMLFSPMFTVLLPTLVPMWENGDTHGVFRHLHHAIRYSIAGALPFVVGLTVLAEPLIGLVAGQAYITTRATVGFVATGILFFMLSGVLEPLVSLLRRTQTSAAVYGGVAVANLLASIALVPSLGPLGAAIGTCLAYFLQLCGFYLYLRHHGYAVSLDPWLMAKCVLSCTAMAWVVDRMEVTDIWGMGAAVVAGGAVYALGLICLRVFSLSEMRGWRQMLRPGGEP